MRFGGCRAGGRPRHLALRRIVMHWKFHRSLAALGLIALAAVCLRCERDAFAQLPNGTALPQAQAPAAQEETKRPLDAWQAEVKTRLQELEQRLAEPEGGQPADELKRQQELLSRLDLTLSQAITEANRTQTLEQEKTENQEALDAFQREGPTNPEAATFLELDETRDELAMEQRRLSRLRDKTETAVAALDAARQEFKKRNSERRQSTGEKLAVATVRSEIAEVEVQLREQEAANARLARASQKLHVDLLEEKVSRLSAVVRFGEDELRRLNEDLDRQEVALKQQIAPVEAASTRVNILETLWKEAQQKLDAGTGDADVLNEQVETYRLELRAIQEKLPFLRKQLERLADNREVWQRRQQIYEGRPARATVREWLDETRKATASLKVEEENEQLDRDELQNELQTRQAALDKDPESNRLERQVASLRGLLDTHGQNLASIRTSQQLQLKLLSELESGSLTATFKDRLQDVWNAVGAVWNYELTSFGESPLTVRQVVTALALLLVGVVMSRAISRSLGRQVLRRLNIDASASASIQSLFYYLLIFFFAMFALKVVNVPLAAFTVLGGAVALGVGFGSQNIINNFISGLILHAERPVKVGDLIQLGDLYGNVEHIGARSTRVRTGANLEIIVPNSTFLQNNVINFTLSSDKTRTSVEVGVVYGSPVVTVSQLLRRAVLETGRVSKDPPPIILFKDFGNSALLFEVHFWIHMRTMMDRLQVESTVRYQIEQLFKEEGIVVAFPQQDVHLDTTSPLSVRVLASPPDSAYS